MRIVQIVPEVALGSGVEAVAYHLEREWQRLGIPTARFTLADAAGGWLPTPGPGLRGRAALAARVVWFSTVGTVLARRRLSPRRLALTAPGTVTICHNDVLYGDVYVNHGVVDWAFSFMLAEKASLFTVFDMSTLPSAYPSANPASEFGTGVMPAESAGMN